MCEQEKLYMQEALAQYTLNHPVTAFIRHNENITCRVDDGGDAYVLRIRRPIAGAAFNMLNCGYTAAELMQGELDLLDYMSLRAAFPLQRSIITKSGSKTRKSILQQADVKR